jgi:hypothetical protein
MTPGVHNGSIVTSPENIAFLPFNTSCGSRVSQSRARRFCSLSLHRFAGDAFGFIDLVPFSTHRASEIALGPHHFFLFRLEALMSI